MLLSMLLFATPGKQSRPSINDLLDCCSESRLLPICSEPHRRPPVSSSPMRSPCSPTCVGGRHIARLESPLSGAPVQRHCCTRALWPHACSKLAWPWAAHYGASRPRGTVSLSRRYRLSLLADFFPIF
jgi:hypothetical protein